jgi:hypothetical protein
MLDTLNRMSIKTSTVTNFNNISGTVGPRLQKINPETFILVKVAEAVSKKEY